MTSPDRRQSHRSAALQRSLTVCWKEGIAAQVMIGIVDFYVLPFALALNATNTEIGLLIAIPNLLAAVGQIIAVRAVRWAGDRLRLLVLGAFLQSLLLIPVAALALFHPSDRMAQLIALTSAYRVIGGLMGPAWGSLVSEYLPAHRRGDYFGWRSRVVGIAGVISVGVWGLLLYAAKKIGFEMRGFAALFLAASLARVISMRYLTKMVNLPFTSRPDDQFTFWMFIKRFRESNFVKFVLYASAITFATQISAPFFSPYMLRDLKFTYLGYMGVSIASIITGLISFPLWGRHADRVGNAQVLKLSSFLIPLIPLLWLLPRSPVPLMIVEAFSGFVWGGFNLCVTNFIYDAVMPSKRIRCLGYFNLINGLAIFFGSTLGGWLAGRVPPFLGSTMCSLFLISALGRILAHFALSRSFTEVRQTSHRMGSTRLFFSVVGLHSLAGRSIDVPSMAPPREAIFPPRQTP